MVADKQAGMSSIAATSSESNDNLGRNGRSSTDTSPSVSWGDVQTMTTRTRSGNKQITKKVVTKTKSSLRQAHSPAYAYEEDEFERQPKTDYTYARSGTYSQKCLNNLTSSPNLSRRHIHALHTDHLTYNDNQVRSLRSESMGSNVRSYGTRTRTSVSNANLQSKPSQTSVASAASSAASSAFSAVANAAFNAASALAGSSENANLSEGTNIRETNEITDTIFSEDEDDGLITYKRLNSHSSRSKSPSRKKSTRVKKMENTDSAVMYATSSENSSNIDSSVAYRLSTGLDNENELVMTETTHSAIYSLTEKIAAFFLVVYSYCDMLCRRFWWMVGQSVYQVIQRYLLCETWLLSRTWVHKISSLLCLLLLLFLSCLLLLSGLCGIHALGYLNVARCAQSEVVDAISYYNRMKNIFTNSFTWNTEHKHVHIHEDTTDSTDWNLVIDSKVAALRQIIKEELDAQDTKQKNKNAGMDAFVLQLSKDLAELRSQVDSLSAVSTDLKDISQTLAEWRKAKDSEPDYMAAVEKLQKEIEALRVKLGDLDSVEEHVGSAGILAYLHTELMNLRNLIPKNETVSMPCPDSRWICDDELHMRLRRLQDELLLLIKKNEGDHATEFVNPGNSTGLSEEIVKRLIQTELDTFSADRTGLPDFALQSMGAQIVSTRCSQTYYERGGLMTFVGIPLYHLHKDPSVVIQAGLTPGECWCFHGTEGSLVVELADTVKISSFSLEHISAKQSVSGEISSAPRDFAIYGLDSEMDYDGQRIGEWTYDKDGPTLQFFTVRDTTHLKVYRVVELRVLRNWGKQEFTCLYRFRVHGKLAEPPEI